MLLHELSDDKEEAPKDKSDTVADPNRPWYQDFQVYVDAIEQVPEGWSTSKYLNLEMMMNWLPINYVILHFKWMCILARRDDYY